MSSDNKTSEEQAPNVAAVEPVEEKAPARIGSQSFSFMEVINAIREQYNTKGVIEIDSDVPMQQGLIVAFKAKETGYVLARARVHMLMGPRFDKDTGNLITFIQFIDVSLGPGRPWTIGINTAQ